jgi:hypothetical protein
MVSGFCQWVLIPVGFKTHWLNSKIKMTYFFNHFYLLIYLFFHFIIYLLIFLFWRKFKGYPLQILRKNISQSSKGIPYNFWSKLVHTATPWLAREQSERVWITRPCMVWWFDRKKKLEIWKIIVGATLTLPYISAKNLSRESPNALDDGHVTGNSHFKNETMMVTAV